MQKKHIAILSIEEPLGKVVLADGSVHTFRLAIGAVYRIFEDDGITPLKHAEDAKSAYGFSPTVMFNTVEEPNDVRLTDWHTGKTDKKKAN